MIRKRIKRNRWLREDAMLYKHLNWHHNNPPAPFNPLYDPKAKDRWAAVTESMVKDDYYATHTRAQCKEEWSRRYENLEKGTA
jgi:hypothetical protein